MTKKEIAVSENATIVIEDSTNASVIINPVGDIRIEIKIGKNCKVETFLIQEKKSNTIQINHVGEDSSIDNTSLWLSEGEAKIENRLEGTRSEAKDIHIFIESGENKFHLDSVLRHINKNTKGNILVKGIIRDNATAKLDGMIKIDKTGAGAESFLSEHVMLLNAGAHATANPELEIENNDVSSRHSASVAQIDEEKIFYLEARGISRNDAKKLIVEGFLESAVNKVSNNERQTQLMKKILEII